jgi:hypothetical protein
MLKNTNTHLHPWLIIKVRLGVIPRAFAWVIASSDTWGSLWLQSSCYSWWLPPPRRLGAAVEVQHMLVIVRGRLRWSCDGYCTFLGEAPQGSSSKLLMSLSYLTCGSVLAVSNMWMRFVQHLLATEPPSVGQHNGDLRSGKHVNLERKINCLLPFGILLVIDWYSYCDWFIPRRGGIITSLSYLHSRKLVVTIFLV